MLLAPNGFPITNPDLETFQKCIYANEILSTTTMLTRFIIILFYARIFIQPNFRIAIWIMHILNFMSGIAFTHPSLRLSMHTYRPRLEKDIRRTALHFPG